MILLKDGVLQVLPPQDPPVPCTECETEKDGAAKPQGQQPDGQQPEGKVCKYCGMINCTMPGHNGEVVENAEVEPSVMVHPGIPLGMAVPGVVLVIILTHIFVALSRRKGTPSAWRFDLLKWSGLKWLVKRSWFPMFAQAVPIGLFLLILGAGFFGSQRVYPMNNIAPVLTWTIWWALLIFLVVTGGSIFCAVCPWEGLSSLFTSRSVKTRVSPSSAGLKWPKVLSNIYPAMALFILLTWIELGMAITKSPMKTALMALGFVVLAIVVALFFERRAFCRYLCLVGRVQGMYALFAPIEVRSKSTDVCRTCTTHECYKGSAQAVGCPTSLFPGTLQENTYCTMCTECVRSCPHDNMTVNARPLAVDLAGTKRFRVDEAVFAIVLLALTSFHGLTMTPIWIEFTNSTAAKMNLGTNAIFTILMVLMMVWPIALFWGAAGIARRMSGEPEVSTGKVFKAFAYSVLPIALFYHLAHNGMHFFMEAQHILPVLSDPFGWGWDLFGTAGKSYPPMMTLRNIWWLQLILIVFGHVYSVVVSDRIARAVWKDRKAGIKAMTPLLATMVLYSCFSIWLIAQPMEMRSGM